MIEIDGNELYQWDTGRRVVVTGIEVEHVHFANQGDSKAVIMGAVDIHAQIPDFLLQSGKQLCVYAVKDGITVESKTFYVKKRERPENYVYEDDQRNYIYELVTNAEEAIESMWWAYQDTTLATENANLATENANNSADRANLAANNANETAYKAEHTAKNLMVIGSAKGDSIHLDDAIDQFFVGMRIFGKTTQDGTPTPDAPVELVSVGDNGFTGIKVLGKNLLNIKSGTVDGFTIINNGANIVISGANSNSYAMRVKLCDVKVVAGMQYCLSGGLNTDNMLVASKSINTFEIENKGTAGIYTAAETAMFGVYIRIAPGQTMSNYTIRPQLEIGPAATEYEPYKEQVLSVATPNGLPGIPVASGGNYIDANGQQWICDEIDFARGMYVQRIDTRELTENASVDVAAYGDAGYYRLHIYDVDTAIATSTPSMCTHFERKNYWEKNEEYYYVTRSSIRSLAYVFSNRWASQAEFASWLKEQSEAGTPLTFIYAMDNPIETPLSVEELAAYAALRTYRGNTTVSNDASAYMDIEYVMDAKTYIGRLITGISSPGRVVNVSLPASKWAGSGNLYSQVVSIDGITENSQVNLTPSVEQLAIFYEKDVTFITENDGGVVTVYVIGQKPTNDYTIKASIVEVIA